MLCIARDFKAVYYFTKAPPLFFFSYGAGALLSALETRPLC